MHPHAHTTYCPVIGQRVACLTKLGGERVEVLCPEFDAQTSRCRLRKSAPPLDQPANRDGTQCALSAC